MVTSEEALKQMSKPTATVVKILEENWHRIRKSCDYFESGKKCPLTNEDCEFVSCPLLEEDEKAEKVLNRE